MFKVIQRLWTRPVGTPTPSENPAQVCNYEDNYYGDQICVPAALRRK